LYHFSGEAMSFASRKRKNQNKLIVGIVEMESIKFGHRLGLIFRQYNTNHEVPAEFGDSEANVSNDDNYGTKCMEEGYVKLPRSLKDMFDELAGRVDHDISTIGLIHSGLSSTLLQADRPSYYITRITRYKTIDFSSDISLFLCVLIDLFCICNM
jgi:hypothetical protein